VSERRPVANARMYSVTPQAREAWAALFGWLGRASGVPLAVVDHVYPAPLGDLWMRPDLGAAFMCGWPLAGGIADVAIVAAPIPAAERAGGQPVYWTDLVVRIDSPFQTLEDTFGRRLAFTTDDSQSGFNAVRRLLMNHARGDGAPPYGALVGPVVTPRRALESVVQGEADVAPLDSYAHGLFRRYAPELAGQVRIVAMTEPTPIPPLVASRATDPAIVHRLRETLLSASRAPEAHPLLDALLLSGFAAVEPEAYDVTLAWAKEAEAAGWKTPAELARGNGPRLA
jgi:ABC-type phosphate/phosphonate transport system substrate-binding protein